MPSTLTFVGIPKDFWIHLLVNKVSFFSRIALIILFSFAVSYRSFCVGLLICFSRGLVMRGDLRTQNPFAFFSLIFFFLTKLTVLLDWGTLLFLKYERTFISFKKVKPSFRFLKAFFFQVLMVILIFEYLVGPLESEICSFSEASDSDSHPSSTTLISSLLTNHFSTSSIFFFKFCCLFSSWIFLAQRGRIYHSMKKHSGFSCDGSKYAGIVSWVW